VTPLFVIASPDLSGRGNLLSLDPHVIARSTGDEAISSPSTGEDEGEGDIREQLALSRKFRTNTPLFCAMG
jgi:hypothetical protein